jgi:hypothetical protein
MSNQDQRGEDIMINDSNGLSRSNVVEPANHATCKLYLIKQHVDGETKLG